MKITNTTGEQQAPRHPIAVVAERTGLSPDVLRVWERRYRAVEPSRGPDGHRSYSDADVARLRLLHAATSAGRTIRQVAGLSTAELAQIAEEDAESRHERLSARARATGTLPVAPESEDVEQALAMMAALQAAELEHSLRRSAARLGLISFIEEVATPLLRRIGDMWHTGQATIAQEHLASSIVHDILSEAMRSMVPASSGPTVLVATPTGERHAVGAALIGAAAAADGCHVVYLGTDLPANEIAAAAVSTNARVVALSIIYLHDRERTVSELTLLRATLPASVTVMAGGVGATAIAGELARSGIRVGEGLSDFRAVLDEAAAVDAR